MAHATPYCYKALSAENYNALAAYIVTSTLDASFFPKLFTIVVTPKEDEEHVFIEVGKFIDDEGLSFHINPIILDDEIESDLINSEVTPSYILREIICKMHHEEAHCTDVNNCLQKRLTACEEELNKARKDKDLYYKWWQEESTKRSRLEETIKALRTLLNVVVE